MLIRNIGIPDNLSDEHNFEEACLYEIMLRNTELDILKEARIRLILIYSNYFIKENPLASVPGANKP
jgi:hypothetical protein